MGSTTADVHARKRAEERNGSRTKRTWCGTGVDMEGLTRIELASSVWKTEALPLSYSPELRVPGWALASVFGGEARLVLQLRPRALST